MEVIIYPVPGAPIFTLHASFFVFIFADPPPPLNLTLLLPIHRLPSLVLPSTGTITPLFLLPVDSQMTSVVERVFQYVNPW